MTKTAFKISPFKAVRWLIVAIGAVLSVVSLMEGEGIDAFAVGIAAWGFAPYAVLYLSWWFVRSIAAVLCSGVLVVALHVLTLYEVFVAPSSSTSALALLWSPLWSIIVLVPVGLVLGTLGHRAASWWRGRSIR